MLLDVVTPQSKIVEKLSVKSVVLPGHEGEMEILDGHTELLTLLGTGELRFEGKKYWVSGGFAEVQKNQVIVLAQSCEQR